MFGQRLALGDHLEDPLLGGRHPNGQRLRGDVLDRDADASLPAAGTP